MTGLMNTVKRRKPTFVSGDGSKLRDDTGKQYLDFFCDSGAVSMGYSQEQRAALAAFSHPIHVPNSYKYDMRDKVAGRICTMTGMDGVFFSNSGAESVEAAIKIARLYQHKNGKARRTIYSQPGSFHGRTLATLAAGDGPVYHNEGFGPAPEEFLKFDSVDRIDFDSAAAVLVSPVRENSGVRPNSREFLTELRDECSKHDVALIFDEVQSGCGRASKFMTYAQSIGVKPDVVALAKGIAMGAPAAATLARGQFAEVFTPGAHFSTFGGGPFALFMADSMMDWVQNFGERSELIGMAAEQYLKSCLDVREFRRVGALIAFDHFDPMGLADVCLEKGLIIGVFRTGPGVVKITPPLNITARDMGDGLAILAEALGTLHNQGKP